MEKYLIVDFYNYLHRGLIGPGEKDSLYLTYLFFCNLRATVEQFNPTKLFFAMEGRPKHRYDLFPEYKANRIIKTGEIKSEGKIKQKENITQASNTIKDLLLNFTCSQVSHPDYEADDIVNTLCNFLADEEVVVITGDTDYIQLLEKDFKNTKVYSPMKKAFFEKSKYPYIAEKAIRGDKSDNIPCLLTPKKADKHLEDPELLKSFLEIEENRAAFSINKKLIEFIDVPQEELVVIEGKNDFVKVFEKFHELDFKSFIEQNEKAETKWNKFVSTFEKLV